MNSKPLGDLRRSPRDRGQLRGVAGGDERAALPPQGGQDGARGVRARHRKNEVWKLHVAIKILSEN